MDYQEISANIKTQEEFCFEKNRKKSFTTWVFDKKSKCNADAMAEAGFIFVGSKSEPDAVKCFLCLKSLDCWDEDDDPWHEHLKHSPKCLFAKTQKPERELTLREFLDIRKKVTEVTLQQLKQKQHEKMDLLIDKAIDRLRNFKSK